MRKLALALGIALCASVAVQPAAAGPDETPVAETVSADGVQLFGYSYPGDLPKDAPTVLLFHQGGSSARGEFPEIAAWLNGLGYRAMAWDLRMGGDRLGAPNQTALNRPEDAEATYCAAYADVEAALLYAVQDMGLDEVIVLGSSYSGSLVYQLAAEHPETVKAVLAFSPASGGPVEDCKAELWAEQNRAPTMVLRPAREMEIESIQQQKIALEAHGAAFFVSDPGTHGASMLVDRRAGGDASDTREAVAAWLLGSQSEG